jgi:hypothetical protein
MDRLGMPIERINGSTLAASPNGENIVVLGIKGDTVPIDAATLRYLVDETYAAKMDAELRRLQFTDEELRQLDLEEPPPGFFEGPEDFTREMASSLPPNCAIHSAATFRRIVRRTSFQPHNKQRAAEFLLLGSRTTTKSAKNS